MSNTNIATDTAWTFTLAGALLAAWQHEGTVLGERHLQDVLRMDLQRVRAGLPSVARSGAAELL